MHRLSHPLSIQHPVVRRLQFQLDLDADARREWRRLAPILERMRVLTEADEIALGNLCVQYATLIKAQRLLDKSGLLLKTKSGYVQQSPLVSIVAGCVEQVNKLCREFGLTPAARTRIQLAPEDPNHGVDELEEAMFGDGPPPRQRGAGRDGGWVS